MKQIVAKTWVEISRGAIEHNYQLVKRIVEPATVMLVIKANAYGHGLLEVASILEGQKCPWLCVDNVDEAQKLRIAGFGQNILILGYTPRARLKEALALRCSLTVYNNETLLALARLATRRRPANVHLKIDIGTTRQGILPHEVKRYSRFLNGLKSVHVEGVLGHFANIEDTTSDAYPKVQLARFEEALETMKQSGLEPEFRHCACSAACFLYPQTHFNMVRLGISLYGLWSSEKTEARIRKTHPAWRLKPALTWKTIVAQVKRVPKGTPVSYGLTERVSRPSTIAVLPVGYSDGYDRRHSRRAFVLIGGRRCKILGRVCMNLCMADATDVPRVCMEDEVVLLGKQNGTCVSADELAGDSTIHYEIVSRINPLIPRRVVD